MNAENITSSRIPLNFITDGIQHCKLCGKALYTPLDRIYINSKLCCKDKINCKAKKK